MKKVVKKILSFSISMAIIFSVMTPISASADTSLPWGMDNSAATWGDARWIWSSSTSDRGPAVKLQLNEWQSWIYDKNEAPSSGYTTVGNYSDLAAKQDVWMDFRRDFTLAAVPDFATVNISVDSKYWLWVNGKMVVFEGQVKRGPNPNDTYYDSVDIAKYLVQGKNAIAVQVWYWGGSRGFSQTSSGSGGLLFHSDLIDAADNKAVESGDGKWMALKDPANIAATPANRMLTESGVVYDAQKAIDWTNPSYTPSESENWNVASNIGCTDDADEKGKPGDGPWNNLWVRPIPQWKDYGLKTLPYKKVSGYNSTFLNKSISDLGVTAAPYSIETKFRADNTNASLVFGVVDSKNYLKADVDTSPISSEKTATLTVSKITNDVSSPLLTVADLSSEIDSSNASDYHDLKIEIADSSTINVDIDNTSVGTVSDCDATATNTSFGLMNDGSWWSRGTTYFDEIKLTSNDNVVYSNNFSSPSDFADFPAGTASSDCIGVSGNCAYLGRFDGQRYQIRLPYNCQMVPYLKTTSDTDSGKRITMLTDTYNTSGEKITYLTKQGEQEFEGKNWINGDFVYFDVQDGASVQALGFHETGYNVPSGYDEDTKTSTPFLGHFNSVIKTSDPSYSDFTGGATWTKDQVSADNNFYDENWKKAARSLYVTIRDHFMDCPDRERSQYIGDAINEMEEGFYSLGNQANAIDATAIKNIVDWQVSKEINGRTYYFMSNVRPGNNTQEITAQSLGDALATINLYKYTNDTQTPAYAYQKEFNYLTDWDMTSGGEYDGLVALRDPSTLMFNSSFLADWYDWGNNVDTLPEQNLWYYISLLSVRAIADIPGVKSTDEQKAWLDKRINSIKANFDRAFWNPTLNAYATTWDPNTWSSTSQLSDGSHLVDDRVNALAVVFGLCPTEKYSAMRDVFMGTETKPQYKNASIYMEKYVLQALYLMGYPKDAMKRMEQQYMADTNDASSTTLPEFFGAGSNGTKNHGWSGGSMIALSKYAAGVSPLKPGYQSWIVQPQMGNFLSINTCVPSQIGNIYVTAQKDESLNKLTMTVVSPGNSAEIWVPVEDGQTVSQTSGPSASFVGKKEAYNAKYAVYTVPSQGTYSFSAAKSTTPSHPGGSSGSGSTVSPITTPSSPAATFVSDTTADLGVSGAYTFKITSENGKAPVFVVGTPGVFDVQLVKQVGNDYYYKITAAGAPGAQAGIYINGGSRLLIATVKTNPTYVRSDTTAPFEVKAGNSYVFRLTADAKPYFVAGTQTAFQVTFVKQNGKNYFFKITAVGKAGQASGFYINSHNGPVAVAAIAS